MIIVLYYINVNSFTNYNKYLSCINSGYTQYLVILIINILLIINKIENKSIKNIL